MITRPTLVVVRLTGLALCLWMVSSPGWRLGSVHAAVGGVTGAAALDEDVHLFSFFRRNGEDGLFLAWSLDGLDWKEIPPPGRSFLRSDLGDKLMRDPCLRLGPDGLFQLVWTTGWHDRIVGHAWSRDLLDWSEPQAIPVMMHEPTARNSWAPELFYDGTNKEWLLFWSTTIPGRFPATEGSSETEFNHRAYYVTTRDFRTFSETRLFLDPGFNVIDATLLAHGGRYALIMKDETLKPEARKNLRLAWGERPQGPFGAASEPFTLSWVEGPSALRVGEEVLVYFDHYARPQYYGAVRSRDLVTWDDISKRVRFPEGTRHGTALTVPRSKVRHLLDGR
jgi:hypothetical protein